MSRTNKDKLKKEHRRSQMKLGKKLKLAAKQKRKTFKTLEETNPKYLKHKQANIWDWS